jgi:hypothetical protein
MPFAVAGLGIGFIAVLPGIPFLLDLPQNLRTFQRCGSDAQGRGFIQTNQREIASYPTNRRTTSVVF